MKRNIILIAFAIVAFISGNALPVNFGQAMKTAQKFINGRNVNFTSNRVIMTAQPDVIQPYYVFNIGDNEGFVIVAGDDSIDPILGYSYEGSFDTSNIPDNVKAFMQHYESKITAIQKRLITAADINDDFNKKWENIPTIMNTTWNQTEPYNNLCPEFSGARAVVGCVPLALAQVMNYYKWPMYETPSIPGYTYDFPEMNIEEVVIDSIPSITFDWESASLNEIGNPAFDKAVAEICRYSGQACTASYSPTGTGSHSIYMIKGMVNYFAFSDYAFFIERYEMEDEEEWQKMVYKELAAKRPVILGGNPDNAVGHQFICDGFEDGKYHINWGWGGYCDGFFKLNNLTPDIGNPENASGNFADHYQIVINSVPNIVHSQVYSKPLVVIPGKATNLDLYFNCDENYYTSLQFDLTLPQGITLQDNQSDIILNTSSDHNVKYNRLSNGDYRFIISSTSNSLLDFKDQKLLSLNLNVSNDFDVNKHAVITTQNGIVCNTRFRAFEFSSYDIPTKQPEDELLGDVNNDGFVNDADIELFKNVITDDNYQGVIKHLADMDRDGYTDIADMLLLIDKVRGIKGEERFFTPTLSDSFVNLYPSIDHSQTDPDKWFNILMENIPIAKGVQFILHASDNTNIEIPYRDYENRTNEDAVLSCVKLDENTFKYVVYNPSSEDIRNHGNILTVNLCNNPDDIHFDITDIIFVTSDYKKIALKLTDYTTSGIKNISEPLKPSDDNIYTLQGIRLNRNETSLAKGVYIINGKKKVIM